MKYVYLIKGYDNTYKIGIANNPKKRIEQLQTGNTNKLIISETYQTKNASKIEKALHNFYKHAQINGEWFNLNLEDELNFKNKCMMIDNNINTLLSMGNHFL